MPNQLLQEYRKNAGKEYSRAQALAYCEDLAKSHYENFSLASKLIPAEKRQHIYNIYAFCRWADDLGDEMDSPKEALEGLAWWKTELDQCYSNESKHPVYIALSETIREFDIPKKPFADLINAFTMDQSFTRWKSIQDLLYYCKHSANPVGHLYLYLFGYRDEERQKLADFTCTALQLTNFWQDVSRDLQKDRIYIPQEDLQKFGISEAEIKAKRFDERFKSLLYFEVERTRSLFEEGLKLLPLLDSSLRPDVELFTRGGQAILDAIEDQGFNVLEQRPSLSKWQKTKLFFRVLMR